MRSVGGIFRATIILLAVVCGGLGILRVLDILNQDDFVYWALRAGGAVVIIGAIALVTHLLAGKKG